MSNDLAIRIAEETGVSRARLDLIRNSAAADCTDEELAQLLILASRTGLDPLARQIYMIKRKTQRKGQWVEIATPQTGIDGYRLVADRTDRYAPGREPSYEYNEAGQLLSATAYVKKMVGGTWHEVAATAFWDEYVQTTRDGKVTAMWAKMPRVMLAKCAEALALRRAFPAELSGLYTAEEMAQADSPAPVPVTVEAIEAEVVPAPATEPCEECGKGVKAAAAETLRGKGAPVLCQPHLAAWLAAKKAAPKAEEVQS